MKLPKMIIAAAALPVLVAPAKAVTVYDWELKASVVIIYQMPTSPNMHSPPLIDSFVYSDQSSSLAAAACNADLKKILHFQQKQPQDARSSGTCTFIGQFGSP